MVNWTEYYKLRKQQPSKILKKFFDMNLDKELSDKTAIDLGCGSGEDTVFLLKNGFSVLAVDSEKQVIDIIKNKISQKAEIEFIIKKFGGVKLPKTNVVIANFSIPFCAPKYFDKFCKEFTNCIKQDGYFVGNFLGKQDEWKENPNRTFVDEKQIREIFRDFEIIYFKEKKYSEFNKSAGKIKFWHVYDIIAKKN